MTATRPARPPADSPEGAAPAIDVPTRRLMRSMTGAGMPGPVSGSPEDAAPAAIRIGRLASVDEAGVPRVLLPGQSRPVAARTVVALSARHVGHELLVVHEADGGMPVVTGVLQSPPLPVQQPPADAASPLPSPAPPPLEIEADGQRVVLEARQQLVLRCGAASITLTREGKILLRGAYVSSRASGVHRIQGGSVEIN